MRKMSRISLAIPLLIIGCSEGFKTNSKIDKVQNEWADGGYTGGTTSGGTDGGTSGGTSGGTDGGSTGGGTDGGTDGNTGGLVQVPNEEAFVKSIRDANPGMINDCTGIPIVNQWLLTVVRALQARDPRWGFFKKESPFRIPRDILAYRSSSEGEGTHMTYVIDFVSSGCNNWPSAPEYNDPMPNADVWWNVLNQDTGYADNGTWSFDP